MFHVERFLAIANRYKRKTALILNYLRFLPGGVLNSGRYVPDFTKP